MLKRVLALAVLLVAAVAGIRVDRYLTEVPVPPPEIRVVEVLADPLPLLTVVAAPPPADADPLFADAAQPVQSLTSALTIAPEPQRFYGTADMLDVLAHTPWDVSRWSEVLSVMSCEATTLTEDNAGTVDVESIGDQHLTPFTGPSLGPGQINISANAHLARTFDGTHGPSLTTAWGGAVAMYIKWLESMLAGFDGWQPWTTYPDCTAGVEAIRGG